MTGGGRDRAELIPFNPDEYNQSDDPHRRMGCHTGDFVGMNIKNAQPGWHYAWGNSDGRRLESAKMQGYRVIHADDPERAAYQDDPSNEHQDLDSSSARYPGVILMKRSAQDERRVKDEQAGRRAQLMRGGNAERGFLDGGSAEEKQMRGKRFAQDTHRTYATAGSSPDGEVLDSWTHNR